MRRLLLLCLLLSLLTACGGSAEYPTEPAVPVESPVSIPEPEPLPIPEPEPVPVPEPPSDPRRDTVCTLLSAMTVEEKVGQLFFARCPTANQAELAAAYHLGGYLLFGRDFKDAAGNWLTQPQVTERIASYQSAIPLLIGVDEEGGTVARATRNPNLFPQKLKSPQAVFKNGGLEAVAQDALSVNRGLLALGINVNFAPVADVSTDPAAFIYDRTFGQDAQSTARYIQTAVTAMNEAGIGSVLKHFPGYGDNADTHTGIAVDKRPLEQFEAADFLPFRAGIAAGAGSVLVSHNIVTSMDDTLPASLSPAVHRILRDELGFDGVILTDDLAMDAVEAYAEDGSVAVLAVLAGNDMVVTTDFETQIPAVLAAVEAGDIPMETIDRAAERVLLWKYDLGLLSGFETGD